MNVKNVMKGLKVLYPKPDWSKPRLVSISTSHFAEKSRWVLDISPLQNEYYEEMHCPALHLTTTLVELGKVPRVRSWPVESFFQQELDVRHPKKEAKSKDLTGVPKLVLPAAFLQKHHIDFPDGVKAAVVDGGSAGIVKFLSDVFPAELGNLYPKGPLENEVIKVERYMDCVLGPMATTWSFGNMILVGQKFNPQATDAPENLNEKAVSTMLDTILKGDVCSVDKTLFKLFGKAAIPMMIKFNGVSAASRDAARSELSGVFEKIDDLLARNNPTYSTDHSFLLGTDQMTAADIALASLSTCLLMPQKSSPLYYTRDSLVKFDEKEAPGLLAMLRFANELLEKHPSARYAVELYEKHRPEIRIRKI